MNVVITAASLVSLLDHIKDVEELKVASAELLDENSKLGTENSKLGTLVAHQQKELTEQREKLANQRAEIDRLVNAKSERTHALRVFLEANPILSESEQFANLLRALGIAFTYSIVHRSKVDYNHRLDGKWTKVPFRLTANLTEIKNEMDSRARLFPGIEYRLQMTID